MIRLAHLSDIHFGGENPAALAAAARRLRDERPNLVVVTGDMTAYGASAEFRRAREWLADLGLPALVAPGNHDTPYLDLSARLVRPFSRFERAFGEFGPRVWRHPEAVVGVINTARGAQWRWNWSKGAVSTAQVDRALADVSEVEPGAALIMAVHHPLVEMTGGPMTARVRGGETAARRLALAGVELILSGHIHAPFVWPLPWAEGAYAVGAGTLSRRERGVPPGFNMVDIGDAFFAIRALACGEGGLETWREWSLPRRPPTQRRFPRSPTKARNASPR